MKKKKASSIIWGITIVTIIICVIILVVIAKKPHARNGFNTGERYDLNTGWTLVADIDGTTREETVILPVNFEGEGVTHATISQVLPENLQSGWYLELPESRAMVYVFVEDQPVLEYGPQKSVLSTGYQTSARIMVQLRKEYSGKEIRIEFYSPGDSSILELGEIYIGNQFALLAATIKEKPLMLIGGLLLFIWGAILMASRLFLKSWMKHRDDYFFLGLFSLLLGLWFLSQANTTQFVFGDIHIARYIRFLLCYAIPVPLLLATDGITMHINQKLFHGLSAFIIADTAIAFVTVLSFGYDFFAVNWINYLNIFLLCAYVLWSYIKVYRENKYLYHRLRWLIMSNAILAVGVTFELAIGSATEFWTAGVYLLPAAILHLICGFMWVLQQMQDDEKEKRSANRAAAAKSEFLASMSHEIRTPINAILGLNEMIMETDEDPQIQEYATDLEIAGKDLLSLINKILDSSKISAGKLVLHPSDYQTLHLIGRLQSEVSTYRKPGIKFIFKYMPDIPETLYGDEDKIMQLSMYLIENAYKYTTEGVVYVSFGCKGNENGSITLQIRIADSGAGMSEETLQEVFKQFKQKSGQEKGVGLGLYTASMLAQMMGGSITARSIEGVGSMFTVEIMQLVSSSNMIGKRETWQQNTESDRMETLHGARILVVDDEKMNLKIAEAVLKKGNYIIETAGSGEEAIEMTQEKKYDAIFMDHIMPGMNGEIACGKIKNDPENRNVDTPIIILTAEDSEEFIERSRELQIEGYITKPLNLDKANFALIDAGVQKGEME